VSVSRDGGDSNGQGQDQASCNLMGTGGELETREKKKKLEIDTWKNVASTSRRQRVLNTRPTMLIVTTGRSFLAVYRSHCGISTLEENRAEM
jgi:hypothetical protein